MTGEKESIGGNNTKIFNVYEPLICKYCHKYFEKKTCFRAHIKEHQLNDHTYQSKNKPELSRERPYMCNICEKGFTAKKNLLKHLRVIHKDLNEAEKLQVKKTRCPEVNCLFACRKIRDLRSHIEKYHEIKILKDTLHFESEEGFLKWKREEEDNSISSFVSFRMNRVLRNGTIKKVLLCHRTGQYNPKGTGKHKLKSRGSCKIGGTCPAAMEIMQNPEGQITVFYYKTHLGHSQDVVHLQLSREDRAKLSEKIKQGFTLDAILEDVRESIDPVSGKTKRIHFLSKKDLHNIITSFNNKKTKDDVKTENDNLLLKNNKFNEPKKEMNGMLNHFQSSTSRDLTVNNEPLITENAIQNQLNLSDKHESDIFNVNTDFSFFQGEGISINTTCDTFNKKTPQLLIVSPNISCGTLPEVILLQSSQTLSQQVSKPISLKPKATVRERNNSNTVRHENLYKKTTNTNMDSPLTLKLRAKIQKLQDFWPNYSFLTPKQYEIINRKLDSIINMFNAVNVKTKKKKNGLKKVVNKKTKVWMERGTGSNTVQPDSTTQQNVPQQCYEAPVYAYVCN